MLARVEGFVKRRKVPDGSMLLQAVDDLGDLCLELADVNRSGMHLRCGRIEDDEAARQAVDSGACQRGLADTRLPDEEDRLLGDLLERFSQSLDELTAPTDEQCRRRVEWALPDACEALEELGVDSRRPPFVER